MSEALLALVDISPRLKPKARTLLQVFLQYLSEEKETASVSQVVDLLKKPPDRVRGISSKKMFSVDDISQRKDRQKMLQGFGALLAGADGCLFEDEGPSFNLSDLMKIREDGARIVIVRLAHLSQRQQSVVIAWVYQAFAFIMRSLGGNEKNPKFLLCLDESWDFLRVAPGVIKGLERLMRLGRSFGLGCLLATHMQGDIPRALLTLSHSNFKAGSEQGCFELTKGSKRFKFATRWLLTRHAVHVTKGELLSLKQPP